MFSWLLSMLALVFIMLAYHAIGGYLFSRKTRRWQQSNSANERLADVVGFDDESRDAFELPSNRR